MSEPGGKGRGSSNGYDNLVDRVYAWPGENSLAAQVNDRVVVAERPNWFFDPGGKMPETVELHLHRPRDFAALSHEEWSATLRAAVEKVEADAAAARAENGTFVVGRKNVLLQSPFAMPKSREPRRGMRPRFASGDKDRRIAAIARRKVFIERYRTALAKLREGIRDVVFPAGAYQLRMRGLVCCEPFPAPS